MGKKKALVAGGSGFIGSFLCEKLLAENIEVTVFDSLVTGRKENIEHLKENESFSFIECDIRETLPKVDPFDFIFNLASPASPKDFDQIGSYILETASIGHQNLLKLAHQNQARILYASTSEVYGDPLVHPQTEDYYGNVNPIGKRSCYDEAKRYGEALSYVYKREKNVDVRVARIFNTYGPRMAPNDGRILPNFFTQALASKPLSVYGDGSQTRSYCYVSDLVDGLFLLMTSSEEFPTNLGNPTEKTVKEVSELINHLTGNKAGVNYHPLPENDPKKRKPDISKAKTILKWEPKVTIEEGFQKTYEYFKGLT